MSENEPVHLAPTKKKTDARVQRTRDALGDALIDKGMREPPAKMDELFHRMVWNGVSQESKS